MKRKIALILSVITISGLSGGVYAYAKTTPVAYVSVDINPSVELGINSFNQVISAEAYNADGEKVLDGTQVIDTDAFDAVDTIISNAIFDGYIKEDGSSGVEITTSTDKEKVADKLEESLKEAVYKALENKNIKAEVETENVALTRRDEARKLGITPGKLNLIQKLQELDQTINIEDYKGSSVKDIQKKVKELRKTSESDKTTDNDIAGNTSENINTDTEIDADTTNTNVATKENTDSYTKKINDKKEERSNYSSKKADSVENNNQKDSIAKSEKQNNANNSNLQSNNSNKDKNKNN